MLWLVGLAMVALVITLHAAATRMERYAARCVAELAAGRVDLKALSERPAPALPMPVLLLQERVDAYSRLYAAVVDAMRCIPNTLEYLARRPTFKLMDREQIVGALLSSGTLQSVAETAADEVLKRRARGLHPELPGVEEALGPMVFVRPAEEAFAQTRLPLVEPAFERIADLMERDGLFYDEAVVDNVNRLLEAMWTARRSDPSAEMPSMDQFQRAGHASHVWGELKGMLRSTIRWPAKQKPPNATKAN